MADPSWRVIELLDPDLVTHEQNGIHRLDHLAGALLDRLEPIIFLGAVPADDPVRQQSRLMKQG